MSEPLISKGRLSIPKPQQGSSRTIHAITNALQYFDESTTTGITAVPLPVVLSPCHNAGNFTGPPWKEGSHSTSAGPAVFLELESFKRFLSS